MQDNLDTHPAKEREEPVEVTPTEAKQGTGPRDMLAVLIVSLIIAAVVGSGLLAYFYSWGS